MIESAIVQILRDSSAVGAICADRIYLMTGPQEENATFCIVTSIGGYDEAMHDGPSGVRFRTVQVSCISPSVSTAKQLAKAVKAAIRTFRGVVAGVNVFYANAGNEVDLSGPDYGNQVALDFETSFSEA